MNTDSIMKKYFLLLTMAITVVSVSAKKTIVADTLYVTTIPQMHCDNCDNKIEKNIRFVKGVKEIKTSVSKQKVTIVYQQAKATYDDFVKAFAKIGYKIERK